MEAGKTVIALMLGLLVLSAQVAEAADEPRGAASTSSRLCQCLCDCAKSWNNKKFLADCIARCLLRLGSSPSNSNSPSNCNKKASSPTINEDYYCMKN